MDDLTYILYTTLNKCPKFQRNRLNGVHVQALGYNSLIRGWNNMTVTQVYHV